MGTLSLIFGIIGIGIAVYAFVYGIFTYSVWVPELEASIGVALISGGIGSYFVMKYDSDKKKPENS